MGSDLPLYLVIVMQEVSGCIDVSILAAIRVYTEIVMQTFKLSSHQ